MSYCPTSWSRKPTALALVSFNALKSNSLIVTAIIQSYQPPLNSSDYHQPIFSLRFFRVFSAWSSHVRSGSGRAHTDTVSGSTARERGLTRGPQHSHKKQHEDECDYW